MCGLYGEQRISSCGLPFRLALAVSASTYWPLERLAPGLSALLRGDTAGRPARVACGADAEVSVERAAVFICKNVIELMCGEFHGVSGVKRQFERMSMPWLVRENGLKSLSSSSGGQLKSVDLQIQSTLSTKDLPRGDNKEQTTAAAVLHMNTKICNTFDQ